MQREVKTSVKVHHQPGGESNWKLGWSDEKPKKTTSNIFLYSKLINTTTKATLSLVATRSTTKKKKRKKWRKERKMNN